MADMFNNLIKNDISTDYNEDTNTVQSCTKTDMLRKTFTFGIYIKIIHVIAILLIG